MERSMTMVFTSLSDDEFDSFSRAHVQNNFIQSLGMTRSQRQRGIKGELLGVKQDGMVIAAGSFTYKTSRAYTVAECMQGPLLDYTNQALVDFFMTQLRLHLKDRGVSELVVSPYVTYKQRDIDGQLVKDGEDNSSIVTDFMDRGFAWQGVTMNFTSINWLFVKDLAGIKNEDELLMSLSYRTRKAVRKAQKNGVFIEEATLDDVTEFYDTISQASHEKGFINRDKNYYESVLKEMGSDTVKLLTAKIDLTAYRGQLNRALASEQTIRQQLVDSDSATTKKTMKKIKVSDELIDSYHRSLDDIKAFKDQGGVIPLASIYFICHGSEVVSVIGGSRQDYLYFNGATLLYWHMMLYALEHGYTTYNFYGTFGIDNEEDAGHSVYLFKRGFGGHVVQLVGEFVLPINQAKYRLHHAAKKIKKLLR